MESHKDNDDNTDLTEKELKYALKDARFFLHVTFMYVMCCFYLLVYVILHYPSPEMFQPNAYIKCVQILTLIFLFYDIPQSLSLKRMAKRDFMEHDRVTDYIIAKYKMPWCWTPEEKLEGNGFFGYGSIFNEIVDTLFPMIPIMIF